MQRFSKYNVSVDFNAAICYIFRIGKQTERGKIMKCPCACAGVSRIIGLLGVAVFVVAIIMKFIATRSTINLLGIQTSASHLVLGAHALILTALLFRSNDSNSCDCDDEKK